MRESKVAETDLLNRIGSLLLAIYTSRSLTFERVARDIAKRSNKSFNTISKKLSILANSPLTTLELEYDIRSLDLEYIALFVEKNRLDYRREYIERILHLIPYGTNLILYVPNRFRNSILKFRDMYSDVYEFDTYISAKPIPITSMNNTLNSISSNLIETLWNSNYIENLCKHYKLALQDKRRILKLNSLDLSILSVLRKYALIRLSALEYNLNITKKRIKKSIDKLELGVLGYGISHRHSDNLYSLILLLKHRKSTLDSIRSILTLLSLPQTQGSYINLRKKLSLLFLTFQLPTYSIDTIDRLADILHSYDIEILKITIADKRRFYMCKAPCLIRYEWDSFARYWNASSFAKLVKALNDSLSKRTFIF